MTFVLGRPLVASLYIYYIPMGAVHITELMRVYLSDTPTFQHAAH